MEGGRRRREPVEVPEALLTRLHQARPAEVGQVARNLGLRHSEDAHQIPDAAFAHLEEAQDPEASRIGERPEDAIDRDRGGFDHIRLYESNQSGVPNPGLSRGVN